MINVEIDTYEARVSIRTIYEATQMIRRGALTEQVINASFGVMDKDFNRYVAALAATKSAHLSHMFDWGMIGSPSGRLWKTKMIGSQSNRVVVFSYLPSKKKVPLDPEAGTRRRHVFVHKAQAFENATVVRISPKQAKYLAFINRSKGAGRMEGQGKVFQRTDDSGRPFGPTFSQKTSVIKAGNGQFEHKFTTAFVSFWNAPNSQLQAIADKLARSTSVQLARRASAQNRVANYTNKMKDAGPEARARAQKAINTIKTSMKGAS
jgi:hypothetical protein